MAKIFISYSHKQGEWVWETLVPCLRAGGAELFIDKERFTAGKNVFQQMDDEQDRADIQLLIFSDDYLGSDYCRHEMHRAIAKDPNFSGNIVLPVIREACPLPDEIQKKPPIHIDLCNDRETDAWDLLLPTIDADLGVAVPEWLDARKEIALFLGRLDSVNLVVRKTDNGHPRWRELIRHIQQDFVQELTVIDLHRGATVSRRGLVTELLKASGTMLEAPHEPGEDLVTLSRVMEKKNKPVLVAFNNFDIVRERPHYGLDFFAALRDLITEQRKLVVLIQSYTDFNELLPDYHPLSSITNLKLVELRGKS